MLGYSDLREAAIWVQTTEEAEVFIAYWPMSNSDTMFYTNPYSTNYSEAFTATLIADQVEPGTFYDYQVYINNEKVELPYKTQFQTQAIWRWRNAPPDFTFATGSCAYINEKKYDRPGEPYGKAYEIFEAIHASKPDLMLWLGDNIYLREPDWNTWTGITKRWTHSRSIAQLQPLLASTHHYAIWDDHDYGPNDSDRGWWNKNQTFKAFQLFWANPSYGVGDIEGAITQFQWYDVDFILLDNRFYRSPKNLISENKSILGERQKQWLKDALVSSQGSFKVIVFGGPFLNDAAKFENYSNNGFHKERQEIIHFIYQQNIKNVVFITGDRHHSELSILKNENKPRIVDLTVSPLTSGVGHARDENNSFRVEGTYVEDQNYGFISVKGEEDNRRLEIRILDKDNKLLWERTIQIEGF
jgi:alkaline phosphatase D